jgi:EPS-associated MarR family transcriptional regulator
MPVITDEMRCLLLRRLAADPDTSQRQLAKELGVSLGKLNYSLQALITKGWVKADNFTRNPSKKGYAYLLTPKGVEAKARLTVHFLHHKVIEYEKLMTEIDELRQEVQAQRRKE